MATIKGKWLFNENISPVQYGISQEINFTSAEFTCTGFTLIGKGLIDAIFTFSYKGVPNIDDYTGNVYREDMGWRRPECRMVDFGEAEQTMKEEFYAWFIANATQQAEPEEPTIGGKKFTKLFLGDVVKTVGSRVFRKLSTEEPQDNSIVGVWVVNENASFLDGLPVNTDTALIYSTTTKGTTVFGKLNTLSSTYDIGINVSRSALPNKYCGAYTYVTPSPNNSVVFGRANSTQGVSTSASNIATIEFYSNIESDDIVIDERFVNWLKANATKQDTSQLTDLTGTTWNIPSGFIAPSGYGVFDVNYVLHTTDGDFDSTQLAIGYGFSFDSGLSPIENRVSILPAYGAISNSGGFTASFTGGTDATNASLISWIKQYGIQQ